MSFNKFLIEKGLHPSTVRGYFAYRGISLDGITDYDFWLNHYLEYKMKYKSDIVREAGLDYHNFKSYIRNRGLQISSLDEEELEEYISDYTAMQERKKAYSDIKARGIKMDNFSKWCKDNYGATISEIDLSEFDRLVEEYEQVRKVR